MDRYLKTEKRLAELLGYHQIFRLKVDGVEVGGLHYNKSTFKGHEKVPRWTGDNDAAFRLMLEHGLVLNLKSQLDFVVAEAGVAIVESTINHPDKATAVRFAIVQAVIAKLESKV